MEKKKYTTTTTTTTNNNPKASFENILNNNPGDIRCLSQLSTDSVEMYLKLFQNNEQIINQSYKRILCENKLNENLEALRFSLSQENSLKNAKDYECPVCFCLPINPLMCSICNVIVCEKCLNLFNQNRQIRKKTGVINNICISCKQNFNSLPLSKLVNNTINSLLLECPLDEKCKKCFNYESYSNHRSKCDFEKFNFQCLRCNQIILEKEKIIFDKSKIILAKHHFDECIEREINCAKCSLSIKFPNLKSHEETGCSKKLNDMSKKQQEYNYKNGHMDDSTNANNEINHISGFRDIKILDNYIDKKAIIDEEEKNNNILDFNEKANDEINIENQNIIPINPYHKIKEIEQNDSDLMFFNNLNNISNSQIVSEGDISLSYLKENFIKSLQKTLSDILSLFSNVILSRPIKMHNIVIPNLNDISLYGDNSFDTYTQNTVNFIFGFDESKHAELLKNQSKRYISAKIIIKGQKMVYKGIFKNFAFNEFGILEILVLDRKRFIIEGIWENNKLNGNTKCYLNKKMIFSGKFENNQIQGYGKRLYYNNELYSGEFKNNLREGLGKYYIILKKKDESSQKLNKIQEEYQGSWKNDKKHGLGKLFINKNLIYDGQFENDEFVGKMPNTNENEQVYLFQKLNKGKKLEQQANSTINKTLRKCITMNQDTSINFLQTNENAQNFKKDLNINHSCNVKNFEDINSFTEYNFK